MLRFQAMRMLAPRIVLKVMLSRKPDTAAQCSGETEVKAQIKLRFVTAAGMSVVAIRSFQVGCSSKSVSATPF